MEGRGEEGIGWVGVGGYVGSGDSGDTQHTNITAARWQTQQQERSAMLLLCCADRDAGYVCVCEMFCRVYTPHGRKKHLLASAAPLEAGPYLNCCPHHLLLGPLLLLLLSMPLLLLKLLGGH